MELTTLFLDQSQKKQPIESHSMLVMLDGLLMQILQLQILIQEDQETLKKHVLLLVKLILFILFSSQTVMRYAWK